METVVVFLGPCGPQLHHPGDQPRVCGGSLQTVSLYPDDVGRGCTESVFCEYVRGVGMMGDDNEMITIDLFFRPFLLGIVVGATIVGACWLFSG